MKAKKKKTMWCAKINQSGLYSVKPMKMTLEPDGDYWSIDGSINAAGPGMDRHEGYVIFAAHDKKDVEVFILGVRGAMQMLYDWSTTGAMGV